MTRGRPKKRLSTGTTSNPVGDIDILSAPSTGEDRLALAPKEYPIPETKQDYLALYDLLKQIGVTRISHIENEIARL